MLAGLIGFFEILRVNYLNNPIEQDHRFIKKIMKPHNGLQAFHSAQATIDGIETAHMFRKNSCLMKIYALLSSFLFCRIT